MLARRPSYADRAEPCGDGFGHAGRNYLCAIRGGRLRVCATGRQRSLRHGTVGDGSRARHVTGSAACDHVRRVDLHADSDTAVARRRTNESTCNVIDFETHACETRIMNLSFPYQFDGRGRTQQAALQDYVKQLVEQVLFTSPGERVNLPDFGSGLLQLPFAPNSVEMAAATQFAVQGALQKWLSNYVKVQSVTASAQEAVLTVVVKYSLLNADVTQVQTFTYGT